MNLKEQPCPSCKKLVMKVAVVTNLDEKCGNGEYGRNLCGELRKYFDVEAMGNVPAGGYDLVLINWHPPVVHFSLDDLLRAKEAGMKMILLIQESFTHPHVIDSQDTLCVVDAVVAHEQMDIRVKDGGTVNFHVVPHGIVEVENLKYTPDFEPRVGTAGFCFKAKNMEATAVAASVLHGRALIVAPAHPWCMDTPPSQLWDRFLSIGGVDLVKDWLPEEEVVSRLANCTMNVYAAKEAGAGQSGSVRLMLAARRPTIVLRYSKTCSLFGYEDEIYFVDNVDGVPEMAKSIWSSIKNGEVLKVPNRLLQDCGWKRVGEMFRDLIGEVCGS